MFFGKEIPRNKNKEDNTALHLALKNRHEDVARFLFQEDPEVSYYLNHEQKSPLHKAGSRLRGAF